MMKIDKNLLQDQIEKFFLKLSTERLETLRSQLSDNPKQSFVTFDPTQILIKSRKKSDLQRLAILSWWFPEEIRILVQLQLSELWGKTERFNVDKEFLLSTKDLCLSYIVLELEMNENDFFGNLLNKKACQRLLDSLSFKKISEKRVKRYSGYCRGYRESTRSGPKPLPPEVQLGTISVSDYERELITFSKKIYQIQRKLEEWLSA